MTDELKKDIDVYDSSKKIDPIKLEKEAKRLKEISNRNKQGLFFTIIDYIMITFVTFLIVDIIYNYFFNTSGSFATDWRVFVAVIFVIPAILIFILYCYFFIKSLIIRFLLKRDKKFPKNTPKKILKYFKSRKSIEFYKQVLADEFDPDRHQEIDVYDDNIKTIKVIDFNKLEKEAKRLKRILQKYKQNKIISIINILLKIISFGLLIWGISLFIKLFSNGLLAIAGGILILIAVGLISLHNKIILLLTYLFTNRAKQIPKNAPLNIIIYNEKTPLEFYEKDIYKQFVTKIPGDIDFSVYEYEIIQDLYSNTEDDLLSNAFKLKANVIIRYNVSRIKYNEVSKTYIGLKRYDDVESKSETHIYALAIRILKEKTNSNNAQSLSSELLKLLELKNKGFLSEEEFEDAKKKILKSN